MVIAAVFGIVIYRVVTVSTFAAFKWALIRNNSQVATTGTAVCINFCIIMLLNVVSKINISEVIPEPPEQKIAQSAGNQMLSLPFSAGVEGLAKPDIELLFMDIIHYLYKVQFQAQNTM